MGDGADDAERRADREREEEGEPITPAARAAVERLLDPGEAEDGAIRFLLDGLEVGSIAELKQLVDAARDRERYRRGFVDGLAAYAWWDSGTQMVGTTGRTLAQAVDRVEETWNYLP